MENRVTKVKSSKNPKISIGVIPGHFATNHSHINYYIDIIGVKCKSSMAAAAAKVLAGNYKGTGVETIVCLDECQTLGAFLARELTKGSTEDKKDIYILTPEFNTNGQLIFRDNTQHMVWGKNVILLVASATTGKTINRSLECIKYYGGKVTGICAIFSAISQQQGIDITALFSAEDIEGYQSYSFGECPHCKNKEKIDAIVNSYGYSKIH